MADVLNAALDAWALMDTLPVGVVVHAPDTQIRHANKKALEVLRLTAEQATGKVALDFQWQLVDTYRQPLALECYPVNLVLSTGAAVEGMLIGICDSSGPDITWLTVNARAQLDEHGAIKSVVVTFTENSYERADVPFKDIVDSAEDVIIITEAWPLEAPGPRIVYVNSAFSRLTGFKAQEVIGQNPRMLQRADADPAVRARVSAALKAGQSIREVIYNYAKGGEGYWLDMHIVPLKNPAGKVVYFAAIERDVTEQKLREQELQHFAFHDALTRLPNRRMLLDRLKQTLLSAKRSGHHTAVLFLDLNKFKQLNDTHGHDVGDLLLKEVAKRLKGKVRESDTVARLGGDEFVVLLDSLGPDAALAHRYVALVVQKIQVALGQEYVLGSIHHHGSASVGVQVVAGGDHDPDQVLKDADAAMYTEKKSRVCVR